MRKTNSYVQLDPAVIEQARQMDLLTYLQHYEPSNLRRVAGNVYCTREHDSLKISNGKWYWWSRGFGGVSALDYLIKVKEYSFVEAVQNLTGEASNWIPPPPAPKKEEPKECYCQRDIRTVTEWYSTFSGVVLTISSYRTALRTVRYLRVPNTTTLYLSAKTKAERPSMPPAAVPSEALLSRTHRAAISGIRSDCWRKSRQLRCICLKPPLIYCPMPPTSNARVRTTEKKTYSLCRACINPRKRYRTAKCRLL